MVDADNKEGGTRADASPWEREGAVGHGRGPAGKGHRDTGGERGDIREAEATGAKDVVPRTTIDLIRALSGLFFPSSGRSAPPPFAMSSFSVGRAVPPRVLPSPSPRISLSLSLWFPRGFLI